MKVWRTCFLPRLGAGLGIGRCGVVVGTGYGEAPFSAAGDPGDSRDASCTASYQDNLVVV